MLQESTSRFNLLLEAGNSMQLGIFDILANLPAIGNVAIQDNLVRLKGISHVKRQGQRLSVLERYVEVVQDYRCFVAVFWGKESIPAVAVSVCVFWTAGYPTPTRWLAASRY